MSQIDPQALQFGRGYQPFGPQLENPYHFYAEARSEQPIFYSEAIQAWVVTKYQDILPILNDPLTFSSKDTLKPLVSFSPETFIELSKGYPPVPMHVNGDGINHQRFRAPLTQALSAVRIKEMEPLVRRVANAYVDSFVQLNTAEMINQFAYPYALEVILTLFGIPTADMARAKQWSDDWLALVSSQLSAERQVECARSLVAFQHYFAQLIEERRTNPTDDLISLMMKTTVPGQEPLNETELVNALGGLLLAGHETTTNLIGNGLKLLLAVPERWQKLCDHPEQIPSTLEEILRFDGPVQGFFRTTTKETRVGEYTLPEGTLLLLLYGSANRDEAQFPHADTFDMERSHNRHLGFGHGVHFCIGAPLARLEGRIAFETLCQRLPNLRLQAGQPEAHVPTLMFRGFQQLFVEWDNR